MSEAVRHPYSRAFVIQFESGCGDHGQAFVGRAEHLRTGERTHFASANELMEFIHEKLSRLQEKRPGGANG